MVVVLGSIAAALAVFFFSSGSRHTRFSRDWSSDVCSSDLVAETKHRIVPLWERMEADGEVFATTPGPNGIDRPLFAVSNVITGTVEDGTGHATVETAERPHGWWEPLGYEPAPGTLNIRVPGAGRGRAHVLTAGTSQTRRAAAAGNR